MLTSERYRKVKTSYEWLIVKTYSLRLLKRAIFFLPARFTVFITVQCELGKEKCSIKTLVKLSEIEIIVFGYAFNKTKQKFQGEANIFYWQGTIKRKLKGKVFKS